MFLQITIFLINSSLNGATPPGVLQHFISTRAVYSGSVMQVDSHSSAAQYNAFLNKSPTFLMYQITAANFGRLFTFLRLISDSWNLFLALWNRRPSYLSYFYTDKLNWKKAIQVPKQEQPRCLSRGIHII